MIALPIAAAAVVLVWVLVAFFVRSMVTWKPRRRTITVARADAREIVLEPGRFAEEPGEYVAVYPGGSAQLSTPRTHPSLGITRDVIDATGQVPLGEVAITPDPDPSALLQLSPIDRLIPTATGLMPAWEYGPESASWAIHVHGVRSSRRNALWGVPGATEAGFRSLVIAYRGSPDGPASHRHAGLGYLEAADVSAAIEYAVQNGAQRIVLHGWSMGASAALLAAESSPHRERIAGLVLTAPTVSWRHIMHAGAHRMRVPSWVARLVEYSITSRPLARLVGMPGAVDLDALDWITTPQRLTWPTLVFGSRGDTNVPYELVERFAAANPDTVQLHEVEACTHGWEPNVNPHAYTRAIADWLQAHS